MFDGVDWAYCVADASLGMGANLFDGFYGYLHVSNVIQGVKNPEYGNPVFSGFLIQTLDESPWFTDL